MYQKQLVEKQKNFKMCCLSKTKIWVLLVSGILTICIGVLMYFAFPLIMDSETKKRLVIKEGTDSYKNWKNITVPILLHFYFFNVTNIDEVFNLTSKPALQQLGPYTFREEREKVIFSNNKNGTITYKQIRRWYFEPDKTKGSLNDIVTTLNVPMVSAAAKALKINRRVVYFGMQELFDFYHSSWFVHKPIHELIFDGYEDPIMEFAKKFVNIPFDKFGWFYMRNGTDDGMFNIFSGENDIETIDQIHTWNGKQNVSDFRSPCNMINGSAGDIWPPFLKKSSTITMFVPDICRSISFSYLTEVSHDGVKTYRYYADETQLDNGKFDPNNRCFCVDDICLPAGAVDVSSCKFEAPAVVSYPHFLFSDPIYLNGVTGLNPDPEKHRMFLDIVPELGVPMEVGAKMQINIIFEAIPKISQFQNITQRIYFPVLWFSETAVAGEDISSQFRLILTTIPIISNVFSLLTVVIGVLLTFVGVYFTSQFRRILKKRDGVEYSNEESAVLF